MYTPLFQRISTSNFIIIILKKVMMKKQIKIQKLVLRKKVIGNLNQISGGRPPATRYCATELCAPDDGHSGYTSFCSVILC